MAIIEFVNGKNKTYSGLKRVINYILREDKTELGLYGGFNCDSENAFNNFILTKRLYQKETGRQYIHFVQSFADYENLSAETAKAIVDDLLLFEKFNVYQIVYATHTDTDNLHTHFVLNTVNSFTGKKWRISKEELQELKDFSDEICRKYNLLITNGQKDYRINRGEYRSKQNERSWKYEMFLAISEVKKVSCSRDDFIFKLNKLGYIVDWQDDRKYITFTNLDGKKCRNRKLYPPEKFTKEALEKQFEFNDMFQESKHYDMQFETLLSTIKLFEMENLNEIGNKQGYSLSGIESSKNDAIINAKQNSGLNWEKERNNSDEL